MRVDSNAVMFRFLSHDQLRLETIQYRSYPTVISEALLERKFSPAEKIYEKYPSLKCSWIASTHWFLASKASNGNSSSIFVFQTYPKNYDLESVILQKSTELQSPSRF